MKGYVKCFVLLVLFLISTSFLHATPAIPVPVVLTQPNGDRLTVMVKGDERMNWHETPDGYTLLFNAAGYLSYAQLDEYGNLQPSGFIATNIEDRDMRIAAFLNTIDKNLFYSDIQQQLMLKIWEIEDETYFQNELKGGHLLFGEYKTLCAFVQFPDKSFIKTMAQFEGLMNQLGYTTNGTGSVRDFFKEASYNQFDLTITLCGIYTAAQNESYYAGNNGSQNCQELARWTAQQVAAEPDINFAEYDSNDDGVVDGLHFIFAGLGQEAGGGSGTIWSHKWSFSPPVIQNGKSISIYSCSPELISGSTITTIGVICHEMTHAVCNIPDFYDTDGGTNGQFEGTGNWDLMAGGNWNGSPGGNRPAHHNMYIKAQLGWVIPVVLSATTTITNMPNSAENPVTYQINTPTENEYYLLENRQRVKFDTELPGEGLFIYHVHSTVGTGCINCAHPQRMYPVCAGRTTQMPNSNPASYGNINSQGCPFPGSSNKTAFGNNTTPAMRSWEGANVHKPITNITQANRLISFDFMDGNNFTITATCTPNGSVTPQGATVVFEGGSQTYTIMPDAHYEIEAVLINGENNPTAVNTGIYTFSDVYSNQTIHAVFAPKTYKVTFSAYGGSGVMEPQNFTYGIEQSLTKNSFTKEGYLFKNWNTQANGGGISYDDEQVIFLTANTTLIAQWVEGNGIDETEVNSIQITPNPARDYIELRVTSDELQVTSIEIFDMYGKKVLSHPLIRSSSHSLINISHLPLGIYLIKTGCQTAKLVIQ
jgi:M6 family metalloprotease-like protein